MVYYHPQTKFAKVMFLHVSVILTTGGGGGVGASPCHDSLIFMSTHKATAARCLSRHQATYGLPPSAWPL